MADYIFTQHGDNNVQIGGIGDMPYSVDTALKWALEHNYQSVAAQYARTLAQEVERLRAKLAESQRHRENNQTCYVSEMCDGQRKDAEITALRAENDAFKADIEAGNLVRLPGELIAPYELNARYWICGWDSDACTLTIQDRALMDEAARAAPEGGPQ